MTERDHDADRLDLDTRREIFGRIEAKPGVHFRGLLDGLDCAQWTLQYHLRWLCEEGLLERSEDGKYTRYYPADSFEEADRAVMNALRRTVARRILAYLASDGPLSTSELSDRLEKAPSTVSFHLSTLSEAGLVEKERDGRAVVYSLSDPDRVARLYAVHNRSFTDRLVDQLFELWDAY